MKIVLADFNAQALPGAEAEVKALGAETLAVRMDVAKPEEWQHLLDGSLNLATTKRYSKSGGGGTNVSASVMASLPGGGGGGLGKVNA